MAYDYDVDILAGLWTGAEDGEEPYASFIVDNPTLTNQASENRILSTIELLRSHMELISSRTEAKILHESLSRLIRHTAGGSNPWSAAAAVTEAFGNVPYPTFPAGASLSITIDDVLYSPASPSGGDINTVVNELNNTLDDDGPNAEITRFTIPADDLDGDYGGTHFTINSANDATNYYAWFEHDGQPETTTVTTIADTEGDLGGLHFTLNSTNDATNYYVWLSHDGLGEVSTATLDAGSAFTSTGAGDYFIFSDDGPSPASGLDYYVWYDVDAGNTDPAPLAMAQGIEVDILGTDTAGQVSDKTAVAIDAFMTGAIATAVSDGAGVVTITMTESGDTTDITTTSGPGILSVATVTQGIDPAIDPAPMGLTEIDAEYSVDDSATAIATAITTAVDAVGDFNASSVGDTVTITNTSNGITTDAADFNTGFVINTTQQGIDPAVDPAPMGLTEINVEYSVGDTATEIASSASAAIGGLADFGSSSTDESFTVTNAATGPTTDAADVDSGVSVLVTQQGSSTVGDAVPVEAYKTSDGRLAFRSETDFLSYSISNGSGGIIGPAGIIPGDRVGTIRRIANTGRDLALNYLVGSRA